MPKFDYVKFVSGVHTYIAEVIAPMSERLKALESRAPEKGDPGQDADPEVIRQMVQDAAKEIPPPADGKDGENGKDADPEEIKRMIDAAVAEIPKPVDGKDGADGKDGESVPIEDVERMIQEAVDKAVSAIPKAKDGENGKDALDIEILPAIDENGSVPRGTYATHKNGLWRSFQKTKGFTGWECIVAGVDNIDIIQEDERTITVNLGLSSGETAGKSFSFPVVIDKGVYKAGEYRPGDFVTWAGSGWVCHEITSDKPGEASSKGWRLAVKKGRDGRDGKDGKDAPKPVKIKDDDKK